MEKENERGKSPDDKEIKGRENTLLGDNIAAYWLSALVESADDAIISKTLDGIISSWNKSAENIFGYSAEEAIGKPVLMLIPPERHGEEAEILAKIRAGERVEHYETVRRRKDGKLIDISLTVSPIKDGEGKIIGASKIAREITQIKLAEEKLRESREMLRLAMSGSRMGAWSRDLLKDSVEWSEELEAIFGLPTGAFSGSINGFYDYVYPSDRERIKGEIWKALDEHKDYTIEFRFQHPDGDTHWMEGRGRAVYAPGGKPTKVYGIGIDITERKQAEEELRKSDARLRLALDIAQTSAFEIDLLTDAVETDEIGREIYGFEKDEPLTFSKVQSRFHPDDLDYVMQSVSAALAPTGSDEFEVEQRIFRADGEIRWIRVRGRVFFDGEGESRRAVTCLGTYIDITERKQAEQEREKLLKQLEAERARLQYLFTKAPAFVATLRGPEHVFELTNPAYLQLIGHRDVIGKTVREALPEVEGQGFFKLLDNVFQSGEAFTGREIRVLLQREPGAPLEECFVDFVYQPIFEADGSVSGIFVHGVEITEQVRARKDAEEANRAKDEFLATLSHELRTPLNAILGWSKMMSDSRLDENARQRALETIQRNARVQSQLIDDILDVSRIISGKLKLEIRPVELSSVVESAVESVLPAAEAKEIRLQRVLDYGNSMVSGDPNRLQQIIWNLLSNAVKFTPKGGRVQIRLERVNSHVEIIVTDTGIGISPKVLPFIFDRFRQADSATTRQHGGLGLGLAIVRHLVEMHGGTVEAESGGSEQGSTFTVRLPLIALRSIDVSTESAERVHPTGGKNIPFECTPELEGLHILVVDDEDDGRRLVTTVLEQCGAKVTEVNSAAAGLKAIKELRPDILLSDLGMPGEDGYSLIKKVRALSADEGGQIPAAALTAYARVEDRMRVLRAGFQIHLPKPVEPAELVAVVASLGGRHKV
ncbi:MAG TPA: PAS domain S-box protein [Pyrinomonadaceae bacterium]|nr:PAS domain S-box protein [Pyrinomonadaceae bacterium]